MSSEIAKSTVRVHPDGKKHWWHVRHNGTGFWGDVWDGIKKVGSVANDIAKKTGIVSTLAGALGHPELAAGAKALGYGKKIGRGETPLTASDANVLKSLGKGIAMGQGKAFSQSSGLTSGTGRKLPSARVEESRANFGGANSGYFTNHCGNGPVLKF